MNKVLSINNYYYPRGGADILFLEHNKILERYGVDVIPFSMKHSKNLETPWSRYFVEEIEIGSTYSLLEKLIKVSKVIYSFEAREKLGKLLDKHKVDLCHAHNIYHHISPSILSMLKDRGVPIVMTLHDLKLACPAYKMLTHDGVCERCKNGNYINLIRHKCIRGSSSLSMVIYIESVLHKLLKTYSTNVDRFIVPSMFYKDKLSEWGMDAEKIIYIPNFVDSSDYSPVNQVGKHFIYFGRLSSEKGLKTLIHASVRASVPVKIVGTGPDEQELKRLKNELSADIEFLGYKSGVALRQEINRSRAVILPSEWYENAPLSILESYAMAKPVIGSNIGGIPELIKIDKTGSLFETGSVDALAEQLKKFMRMTESQINEMGWNGKVWVESNFSVDKYRERILDIYTKLKIN